LCKSLILLTMLMAARVVSSLVLGFRTLVLAVIPGTKVTRYLSYLRPIFFAFLGWDNFQWPFS